MTTISSTLFLKSMLGIRVAVICLLKAYIILIRNKNNIDTESNSDESAIKREKKTNDDSPKKVYVPGASLERIQWVQLHPQNLRKTDVAPTNFVEI